MSSALHIDVDESIRCFDNPNYYIYPDGRIYTLKHRKFLLPNTSQKYTTVSIVYDIGEKTKSTFLHRIIAKHFIINMDCDATIVKHKNSDRRDNNASNLEWTSHSASSAQYVNSENYKPARGKAVDLIDEEENIIQSFNYVKDAANFAGISGKSISDCCKHIIDKTTNKENEIFIWRYSVPEIIIPLPAGALMIENYSKYYATKDGKIYSMFKQNYLITTLNKGYESVNLVRDGSNKFDRWLVHRLIYSTFNPNALNDINLQVNHINSNRADNRLENLEVVTPSGNILHSYTNGNLQKIKRPVNMVDMKTLKVIKRFDSMTDAQNETGIDKRHISKCVLGTEKSAGGYFWECAKDTKNM
jgi:hypothetical protein